MEQYPIWNTVIPFVQPGLDTPDSFSFFPASAETPAPCVVVLPGGGYHARAAHEGAPVAEFFRSNGFHAAVVNYRVAPYRFPAGLADVQRVIRILREKAEEWNIDPAGIFVCGFSAGGHLAASTAFWESVYERTDGIDDRSPAPDGLILCYPVISFSREWGHPGSGKRLLGEERYETEQDRFCLSDLISDSTPPTFLWHTADDKSVPVENSLRFAGALAAHRVPFQLHVFPHGCHGLGLAPDTEDVRAWSGLAANWVRKVCAERTSS